MWFRYKVLDYVDYANFRAATIPLVAEFCSIFDLKEVNRFAARYVNRIALLRLPDEPITLRRYLNLGFNMPEMVDAESLEDVHLQIASRSNDIQTVITLHHQGSETSAPECLLFVIESAIVGRVGTEDIEDKLDKVHTRIEDLFAGFVAEPYMKYLKGETV